MEDGRRPDQGGPRDVRHEDAARQAPHRLRRGARARRGRDRRGDGRARADHRRGVGEGLDPRAARPRQADLSGVAFKADDGLKFAFPAETTSKILVFATNGRFYTLDAVEAAGRARPRRAGAAVSSTWSRTPSWSSAFRYQGGRKFLVGEHDGPRLRRGRGRMPRQHPQGQAGAQRQAAGRGARRSRRSRASWPRRSARTARC